VWKRQLYDVKSAEKVCGKLVAQIVVVLVFACSDDAVPGAIRYDIHMPPVFDTLLDNLVYRFAYPDVAQESQAIPILPLLHLLTCVLLCPSHRGALVAVC
jgi:hypothetical protein